MGVEYKAGTPEAAKVEKFLKEEMGAKFWPSSGIGIKPISQFELSKRPIRRSVHLRAGTWPKERGLHAQGQISRSSLRGHSSSGADQVAKQEFGDATATEAELG